MVNKCKFCPSGKKESNYTGGFHTFPSINKNPVLREKWISAAPEANFVPKKSTRICDRHFDECDFKMERTDENVFRNKSRGDLLRRELREDAVPHIWPGFPDYFSKISPKQRSITTISESRTKRDNDMIQKRLDDAREKDRVVSTADIKIKLEGLVAAEVQTLATNDGKLILYQLCSADSPVSIKFSLTISSDLSFELASGGVIIPYQDVKNISGVQISYASEVAALVSFLAEQSESKSEHVVTSASTQLENLLERDDVVEEKKGRLRFIIEQLNLLSKVPTRRRYEMSTLATCMSLLKTSPAAYKELLADHVLTLPSVQHLRRLSSALTVDLDFSPSTVSYLKARVARLNEREKVVSIILDEVKTDQQVDYTGGNIIGEVDGVVTKGLLAVMIKSSSSFIESDGHG